MKHCPRCKTLLESFGREETVVSADTSLQCHSCRGVFIAASEVREELFSQMVEATEGLSGEQKKDSELECPICQRPMQEICLGGTLIDRCLLCKGVWLDGGESFGTQSSPEAASILSRYLLYSLSLPERVVRSTIGLAAGAAKETAEFLVPAAFQNSKTYEIVVRNSLKFLTEDIGGAARSGDGSPEVEDYFARKAVGNFVDLAGLATLHLSPLWLLAIVSDVAYGSKSYVLELADELRKQGLIDENSTIHNIDDMLEAIQSASGSAASVFDTPPISIEQLKQTLLETRSALTSTDYRQILPEAELERYWQEIRDVAEDENLSVLSISAALTMHTLGKLKTISKGTLTGLNVVGGLFNRHVVGHYADALENIRVRGFYQTVRESYEPYVAAVWNNFSVDRQTWTDLLLNGQALHKVYTSVSRLFGASNQSAENEVPGSG